MRVPEPRTRAQVESEINFEWQSFQDADLAGDKPHADEHYERMNELLEEYGRIPHQRQH